jgi:hypothetical protein
MEAFYIKMILSCTYKFMMDNGLIEMIILWLLFELSFELNIKL